MNKTVTTIIVIILLVVGGILLFSGSDSSQEADQPATTTEPATTSQMDTDLNSDQTDPDESQEIEEQATSTPEATDTTAEDETDDTSAETEPAATVTYQDGQFTPQNVTVSQGETVRFVSEGGPMWVGSDQHPSHTEYDGTSLSEHCNGQDESFDQCESGQQYSFTFEKTGEFGYHNHERPSAGGTVIVQ